MSERRASALNRLYANTVYGGISAICVRSSVVLNIVVGDNPTRWHATRTSPDVLAEFTEQGASKWPLLQSDNNASLNPAKSALRRAAVFYTPTEALRNQFIAYRRPTMYAAAFTVGDVVVAGAVQSKGMHEDFVAVGLRHDRRERLAAIGIFDVGTRQFIAAEAGTTILADMVSVQEFAADKRFPDIPLQ